MDLRALYQLGTEGWTFNPSIPNATPDTVNNKSRLRDIYFMVDPNYEVRVTCLFIQSDVTLHPGEIHGTNAV